MSTIHLVNAMTLHSASLNYMESRIVAASPVELVVILHEGALQSIREARTLLGSGDPLRLSRAIAKAEAFVAELLGSLDMENGGPVGANLEALYRRSLFQLRAAHVKRIEEPLVALESELANMLGAWRTILTQEASAKRQTAGRTAERSTAPAVVTSGGWLG